MMAKLIRLNEIDVQRGIKECKKNEGDKAIPFFPIKILRYNLILWLTHYIMNNLFLIVTLISISIFTSIIYGRRSSWMILESLLFPDPSSSPKISESLKTIFSLKEKEEEEEETIVNDFKTKRNNYPIIRHGATTNAQTLMNTIACV